MVPQSRKDFSMDQKNTDKLLPPKEISVPESQGTFYSVSQSLREFSMNQKTSGASPRRLVSRSLKEFSMGLKNIDASRKV